ncbi:hypothetical protein [Chryseobacterium tongliaoense]|uniref:hypothetical protein n=1 Tax=Chryseobacterium tongliaoense TaxID=3240933 RepID=UPI003518D3DE
MKKIVIAASFLIFSCKGNDKEPVHQVQNSSKIQLTSDNKPNESEEAKKWLEKSIRNYFESDLKNTDEVMREITTDHYYEYKNDAMNVDIEVDGSLTKKEFQDKWHRDFDVQKAGINVGFLITGQDWDEIKISKCQLILESDDTFLYDVVLTDEKLNAEYPVTITVIKNKDSFLIADVWQKEPEI